MIKHVYANSVIEWYVAESAEEAARLAREDNAKMHGPNLPESECDFEFEQEPDDKELTLDMTDGGDTKTCAEWAAENPVGFLATTEY